MSATKASAPLSATRARGSAGLLALGVMFVSLLAPARGQVEIKDALPYSTSYLLTGDYVAAGVNLGSGDGQVASGDIQMSGVPEDAEILAAFLYWESVYDDAVGPQVDKVEFRGFKLPAVKTSIPQTAANTSCWATGAGKIAMFRADVLPFLPVQKDADDNKTGKRLVNGAHRVTLPKGNGNNLPDSAGATLVVVYVDRAEPLRKIVFYDGSYIQPQGGTTTQRLRGYYQSAANPSAKMTHMVGSGAPNGSDTLIFEGTQIPGEAFPETGTASDRTWFTKTVDVSGLINPVKAADGQYGQSVTTSVTHSNLNPNPCMTWAGIIFSAAVKDDDADGLPDALEEQEQGLINPDGQPLPNLYAMGARSNHKDILIEVNAMRAAPGTTYGSGALQTEDADGHNHMPTPEVLKMVGDAYKNAPVTNLDETTGINPLFDVGDIARYRALGPDYQSTIADSYLVTTGARGGEIVPETACIPSATVKCQFPDYPGTVAWKFGFQTYRDAPVAPDGGELTPAQQTYCLVHPTGQIDGIDCGRQRFDRVRSSLFHYALYAHARAKPKSPFPCLDGAGTPVEYADLNEDGKRDGVCAVAANPEFQIPKSISGTADLPGGNLMITLGLWDNFVGTPFVQASTTLHELGHNLNLWHGGIPATFGNQALQTSTYIEPNCKPNYLSSMSYLFQVHGLYGDGDTSPRLDYSSAAHGDLNENELSDGPLGPMTPSYRPAWFAPAASPLAVLLGSSAATKFCNGNKFNPAPGATPAAMARVEADGPAAAIDWNGDGVANTSSQQNVNFDGSYFDGTAGGVPDTSSVLRGFDDWSNIRLDQIGAGRAAGRFQTFEGSSFEGSSFEGSSFEGSSFEGSSFEGSSFEGSSFEGSSFEGSSFEGSSFEGSSFEGSSFEGSSFEGSSFEGSSFEGSSFEGSSFEGSSFEGSALEGQELDFETAKALGRTAPHGLKACVLGSTCAPDQGSLPLHRTRLEWKAPNFGTATSYSVYRVAGTTVAVGSTPVLVGTTAALSLVDSEELPNGVQFTYFVRALFDDGVASGASKFATVTAVNDPPVAYPDGSYAASQGMQLSVPAPGVLGNDTDSDSPSSSLRARLVTAPVHGALTLDANGSFIYTPTGCYETDSFVYAGNNGTWSRDPSQAMNSADSNTAAVTITINCAPVAQNDSYSLSQGGTLTAGAPGVLANDTDANGDVLTAVLVSGPSHNAAGNSFVLNSDGSFTYTPLATYSGSDSFTYKARGGGADSNVATVTISIAAAGGGNRPPVANPDNASVITGASKAIAVLANDSDPDGNSLTITGVSTASRGTVTFTSGGVTYAATSPNVGPDSFTYTISDGKGGTATGTVTVNAVYGFVNVQNLPPAAGKTFSRSGSVAMAWKYTNAAGVAIDSIGANPEVIVTSLTPSGNLPPNWTGDFTVANPGSSSYQLPTAKNGYTWQFNWKLVYTDPATGKLFELPAGSYLVVIKSNRTGQQNPTINGTAGAVITVK